MSSRLRAAIAIAGLASLGVGRVGWAHKNGIAGLGCDGCHSGGKTPTVTLQASPENPSVGQTVTLTITVSQTNGPAAGFFLTTGNDVGTFKVTQAGTQLIGGGLGVTHTMPRIGSGGVTTFSVGWSASQPTGVEFLVDALSANNDGTPVGDAAGSADLSITSGCSGASYYLDQDGDGYGTSDPSYPVIKDCTQPMGYAPVAGDCDDFSPTVHPGAPELCDGKDNNCDGHVDENVVNQRYCEDKDGDGHGITGGASKIDCAPSLGYGDCGGDCNDTNPAVYPGATEICDNLDNNCDGRVDEGVRISCGVGWCRRYALGCTTQCTPGPPLVETCNLFDDDCDGVVDNGTDLQLCGAPGLSCVAGNCVPTATVDGGATDAGGTRAPDGSTVGSGGGVGGGSPTASGSASGGCQIGPSAPDTNSVAVWATWLVGLALGCWTIRPRAKDRRNPIRSRG